MADYREQNIQGVAWTRACAVNISNPYGAPPTVQYQEHTLLNMGEHGITPIASGMVGGPVDLSAEIAILDQTTLEPTGQTVPIALVYAALFSDYIARARARDAAAAEVAALKGA